MTGQEYINTINLRKDNPYSVSLLNTLIKMDNNQLDACASIAYKYYNNIENHIGNDKSMMVIAKAILEGKNPQTLIGLNYSDMIKQYNNIEKTNTQQSKDEIIKHINQVINNNNFNLSNSFFIQSNNVDLKTLPIQGWKFHISASSLYDYKKLCDVVIPEFNKLNIKYKVVRPEMLETQTNTKQAGKAITAYFDNNFDVSKFSNNLKNILFNEDSISVSGDKKIMGRVHARYGRIRPKFSRESFVTDNSGKIFYDAKVNGEYAPHFVKSCSVNDILNFNKNSYQKFLSTQDYKTYLQEKYTMTECDQINHCYVAFQINPKDEAKINSILNDISIDNFSQSFICKEETGMYAMIHKTALENFINKTLNNIVLNRPEWDIKTVDYIVPNKAIDTIKQSTQGLYGIDFFDTLDGISIVRCDSVFNDEYKQIISENLKIPMALYDKNNEKFIQNNINNNYNNKNITFLQNEEKINFDTVL